MFGGSKKPSSAPSAAAQVSRAPSIVSSNLKIVGDMESDGDIQIDGHVDGDIRTDKLTIGEQAVVNGCVRAEEVMVSGTVNGAIEAGIVKLYSTAKVTGDVSHETLAIEAGAFIQGLCKRVVLKPKTEDGEKAMQEIAEIKKLAVEDRSGADAPAGDAQAEKPVAPPTLVKS